MQVQVERQHVLTKKEKAVMRVIYQEADKQNGSCLITPIEIFEKLPLDLPIEEDELDTTLRNLEIDDYFDITRSDKKGELVYCINAKEGASVCKSGACVQEQSLVQDSAYARTERRHCAHRCGHTPVGCVLARTMRFEIDEI